ncbi:4-carboxymuconolactone decarboxylase domain/alkylhydroperoxidase AhpD family core domain protein [Pseudomonas sp. SHC52]|nr:4-carboxymuconolactone decarboxylase domain/alkylhydroperoxidase AhpD family core domain protein [Pseudomonas sp. SHC52]
MEKIQQIGLARVALAFFGQLDLSSTAFRFYRERITATEPVMSQRLDYYSASPGAMKAMIGLEALTSRLSIEPALLHLIKIRASQLNGCAFCTDMHSVDARRLGETERRLFAVAVWRDSRFFTDRERAALAWTEAVTLLAQSQVPDDVYAQARACFSEEELVDLTMAISTINSWNRLAVSFRQSPVD